MSTYLLQDTYEYNLPDQPINEEILFWDFKKEDQYWRHPNYNFEEINKKYTDQQKIDFVERELKRRIHGCWFYNNGEPTYITGSHYFFMVYFRLPIDDLGMSSPAFRKYQKELFYFLDLIDKDKYCEGAAISKPRRVGATGVINCDVMNLSMTRSDKIFSIQNKKLEEAQRFNYAPIKWNIEHFPSIKLSNGKEVFIPKISSGNVQNRRMKWGISVKEREEFGDDELNTQIYIVPSVQNADDGGQAHRLIRDEPSKYDPKINLSTMLSILRPVAQTGTSQVGKILMFCTSDVEDTPNFEEWKKIYLSSDYNMREKRKTKTGLYKYFISAKYSLAGEVVDENDNEIQLFDVYGNCNEDAAIQWLEDKKRDARLNGDTKTLQEIRRNFPIVEQDAFDGGAFQTCYDNARLAEQLYNIEKRERNVRNGLENPFYTVGDLEWVIVDKEVRFIPNPFGHWKIFEMPDERWMNQNYIDRYNFLCPKDDSPYLAPADPTDYREKVKGGSKDAIVVGSCIDSGLKDMGGKICARYNHRPPTPNEFAEEYRKGLIFYAAKGLPENNKIWLSADLLEGKNNHKGYGKFLVVYENGMFRPWRPGDKIAGISNQQKSIESYIRDTNNFIKEAKQEGEIDYLKFVWDDEIIKQWMAFNILDTQKFDLAVTASMWCMLVKNFNRIKQQPQTGLTDQMLFKAWYGVQNQNKKSVGHWKGRVNVAP